MIEPTTTHTTSEMQLRLALALVILAFKERVDNETRRLLELDQEIEDLRKQREAVLSERTKDTDYLARSLRHLYPHLDMSLSEEGHIDIPAHVLHQLQQVQQTQNQFLLAPLEKHEREIVSDKHSRQMQETRSSGTSEIVSPVVIADTAHQETSIHPDALQVLAYVFSQPGVSFPDWKTTVQAALKLSEPPKIKGHRVYKELQNASRILESMHDGDIHSPSPSLTTFYTQYFVEGERWGDFKDTMSEWGVSM